MNWSEIGRSLKKGLKWKNKLKHRQAVAGELFGVRPPISNFKFQL